MKKFIMLIAAFGLLQGAAAQEKSGDAVTPDTNVEKVQLAAKLAKYGYANYSALALIEAASILNDVPAGDLKPEAFEAGEGELGTKEGKAEFTVAQLLKDARDYADGDATLLALADGIDVAASGHRGAVGGASRWTETVKANTTDVYRIRFAAGQTAAVFVSGDGDTDLDLYIYDENGNLITKDDDYTDDCYCSWTPRWTGTFVIKIKNRGNVYNRYVIYTN